MKVFKKIIASFKEQTPFVAYRFPNKNQIKSFFQQNTILYTVKDFTEKGFVFAPFNTDEKTVIFPISCSDILEEKIFFLSEEKKSTFSLEEDSFAKENYLKLVEKSIATICEKKLQKIVLSRKEVLHISDLDKVKVFKRLLQTYKNAFVYIWFHPKVGLWMGATPEKLLQVKNNQFSTVALAGTKEYKGTTEVVWQEKEQKEQQFVTDFILENVKPIAYNIHKSETKTIKAGSLLHLKTEIKGNFEPKELKKIITILHPTPAVCGLPRNTAKAFILQNEKYNRSFYTGFLGELNSRKNTELFVNLRCIEMYEKEVLLYVGGGITKDSSPEKEWEETVAKSKIMKKVL